MGCEVLTMRTVLLLATVAAIEVAACAALCVSSARTVDVVQWQAEHLAIPVLATQRTDVALNDDDAEASKPTVIEFDELDLPQWWKDTHHPPELPESILRLNDRQVRIRGYMSPTIEEGPAPHLMLVPEVPFNSLPTRSVLELLADAGFRRIRYWIPVLLRDGHTISWDDSRISTPLEVSGTLSLEYESDGSSTVIFMLRDATVAPAVPRTTHTWAWTFWGC
jgi:hypothetical protein